MAEEREQIIIDVQTNTESTIQKMADLKEQIIGIQDARKELLRLQKQNGDLTAAEARTLAQLDVSLKAARSSYEKLTNEAIREQRALEQANGVITDSINGMKQALADATAQYNNLSKAEREAAEGQQLMQHIAELSNALAESNEAFKNLKSNLNNVGDITETVKDTGCKEEDLEMLAEKAMEDPCKPGNPREVTKEDFIKLYKEAM